MIVDQIKLDRQFANMDESRVLNRVFQAVEEKEIKWPSQTTIGPHDWIEKMLENPNFYRFHVNCLDYEFLLFDLIAKTFKRNIILHPVFENIPPKKSEFLSDAPEYNEFSKCWHIFGQLGEESFYCSVESLNKRIH